MPLQLSILAFFISVIAFIISIFPYIYTSKNKNLVENNSKRFLLDTNVLDDKAKIIMFFAGIIIIFSFIAPYFFTRQNQFSFTINEQTNYISSTIGGLINPFITLAGVLVTFLAFYIQYKANKTQIEMFNNQREEQDKEIKKERIISQFYEMIHLHKENVNEMKIKGFNGEYIEGRNIFVKMKVELHLAFSLLKEHRKTININATLEPKDIYKAYTIFFFGINFFSDTSDKEDKLIAQSFKDKSQIIKENKPIGYMYNVFSGHQSRLAHYYRHLIQTVKHITKQNEELFSYNEKREYLRILRAQLSNHEQLLLYYNWKVGFGKQWESDKYNFFTDYRMIHNINPYFLFDDPIFNLKGEPRFSNYKTEIDENGNDKDKSIDTLFESESWGLDEED